MQAPPQMQVVHLLPGGPQFKTLTTDPEMTNLDFYDKPGAQVRGASALR